MYQQTIDGFVTRPSMERSAVAVHPASKHDATALPQTMCERTSSPRRGWCTDQEQASPSRRSPRSTRSCAVGTGVVREHKRFCPKLDNHPKQESKAAERQESRRLTASETPRRRF